MGTPTMYESSTAVLTAADVLLHIRRLILCRARISILLRLSAMTRGKQPVPGRAPLRAPPLAEFIVDARFFGGVAEG